MPVTASLTKIQASRKLGAEVHLFGSNLEESGVEARRLADAQGLAYIHPYDDWDIVAGQASCGLEMLEDCPDMTTVVVPLGGGGLLSGIALAIKLQRPDVRIIGVQTDAVAPYRHFLENGEIEAVLPTAHTIADGIKVKRPGEIPKQIIARYVDEIVTVDDNAISEAIVTMLERTRTIGEGAGVVGLAALLKGKVKLGADERVVVVMSGGNVDMTLVGRSIDFGLAESGRLVSVAVAMPDSPGSLARLLRVVADIGMNVRHVEHRRGELHVPVGTTNILLQMESRDFDHQRELLAHFADQGLSARILSADTGLSS